MKITVLLENATPSSRFVAKHGLSLLLEANGARVLFDMGPDGSFLDNARTLGVDAVHVDCAVISHGHYDHGGGLRAYLEASEAAQVDAPIYVRRGAFAEHVSGTAEHHHDIGLDASLDACPRLVPTDDMRLLGRGMMLFSGVGGAWPRPSSNGRLLERRDAGLVPDPFVHEQSLLVHEGDRYLLVSGCSHAGILNIMDRAETLAGAPIDTVIAGFHLTAPSAGGVPDASSVREMARELARRPTRYATFHCTGLDAYSILRDELGERIRYLYTGSSVEL